MQIANIQNNYPQKTAFTGFKFSPAGKQTFYEILERTNDPKLTAKCLGIISGQQHNPVKIEVNKLDRAFGHKVDGALVGYIGDERVADNLVVGEWDFLNPISNEGTNVVRFLKKLAKNANQTLEAIMDNKIVSQKASKDSLNRKGIETIDEII